MHIKYMQSFQLYGVQIATLMLYVTNREFPISDANFAFHRKMRCEYFFNRRTSTNVAICAILIAYG